MKEIEGIKRLKRVVIKEELVELTGNYKLAIVLNQLIYWSERVSDFDKFLLEERERALTYKQTPEELEELQLRNGWIYKKSEQLIEETMIDVKLKAMREYLQKLEKEGWITSRRNPFIKLDRTLQYRVDLVKIQKDLMKLGYSLEGYALLKDILVSDEALQTQLESRRGEKETSNFPEEISNFQKESRKGEKESRKGEKERTIPKITTEITTEIIFIYDQINKHWLSKNIKNHKVLTDDTKRAINDILKNYSIQEVIQMIDTYDEILNSDKHYYSYRYGLETFLRKGYKNFEDRESALKGYLKQGIETPKSKANSFHNFKSTVGKYTEEELEEKLRRNLENKLSKN